MGTMKLAPTITAASFALLAANTSAQSFPLSAPATSTPQRGGTFYEPPTDVDRLYLPEGPDRPAPRGENGNWLTLRLAFEQPLRRSDTPTDSSPVQGPRASAPTLQASMRARPAANSPWFAQATFLRYLRSERQAPWNPDFTYSFGYQSFAPGTWSLVYANYTGTRLHPNRTAGESRWNFSQGEWSIAHRFALPANVRDVMLVGDGDDATCALQGHWMRRYSVATGGDLQGNKKFASLGCRYTRPEGWFTHVTAFAYPQRGQQQPWDPDFTYGFGWSLPGTDGLTIQYNNYSGNRLPGRPHGPGEGLLRSGSVMLEWIVQW